MKNTIKANLAKTNQAKVEAAEKAARQAELDAIQPRNIIDSITEVAEGEIRVDRNEEGGLKGVNGGGYIQVTLDGQHTIAAKTKEEVEAIKARLEKGIEGDGLLHKTLFIDGMKCECVGATEEELEADIKAAENYAQAHKLHVLRDAPVGEELHEAEIKPADAEQIDLEGMTFILLYETKQLIDLEGNEVANLDHIKSPLTREDIKAALLKDIDTVIAARRAEEEAERSECEHCSCEEGAEAPFTVYVYEDEDEEEEEDLGEFDTLDDAYDEIEWHRENTNYCRWRIVDCLGDCVDEDYF